MDIIQFLLLEIALPLGIVTLLHFKIGTYPQSLSPEGNKRQGKGYPETRRCRPARP